VVRLTGDHYRHIKKRSVPRDYKEYLANAPILSPDLLDLTVEKDQPVVYLVIGGRPRRVREVNRFDLAKGWDRELTKSANKATCGGYTLIRALSAGLRGGNLP